MHSMTTCIPGFHMGYIAGWGEHNYVSMRFQNRTTDNNLAMLIIMITIEETQHAASGFNEI